MTSRVLYVVTCGTGAAPELEVLVSQAQDAGWDVWVIGTPQSKGFVDEVAIQRLSGHAVEFEFRRPGAPRTRPMADAVVVAGASFNTINKWAIGIADNLVMSLLCELIGVEIPIAVLPFINEGMAAHPAFARSISVLRGAGVDVLYGPGEYEPHPARQGRESLPAYPWHLLLSAIGQPHNDTSRA